MKQKFPNEGITRAFRNVFDFDRYDDTVWEILNETMIKHGIPFGQDEKFHIELAKICPLPKSLLIEKWILHDSDTMKFHGITKDFNVRVIPCIL